MHAVIPYGMDLQIDTPDRGEVSAVEYAFDNGMLDGFELRVEPEPLEATGRPGIAARFNPGSYIGQGHVDQWLAIFAMAKIPLETMVKVGEKSLTLEDWARQTQWDVSKNPVDEYAWTLIALTHYFPNEPRWMTEAGVEVSWELLLEYELKQSNSETACGGTHRMAGIVSALNAQARLGLADSKVWQEARAQVENALDQVRQSRGTDGRLSSYYFSRPGSSRDLFAELSSAGHLFEFVALAASDSELQSAWVERAANHLCELLELTSNQELDCGALYHALHGLRVYQTRRFSTPTATL